VQGQGGTEPAPVVPGGEGRAPGESRTVSGLDRDGIVAFGAGRGRLVRRLRPRLGQHDRRTNTQDDHAK
jgi:hypothetical protein